MDIPVGEHNLERVRRGMDGHRTAASGGYQVRIRGEQLLDEAELMVAVGQAMVHVEGRLGLFAANGQSQLDQRFALIEVYRRGLRGRIVEFHHLNSRMEQVVGDDLESPVGSPLQAAGREPGAPRAEHRRPPTVRRRRSDPSNAP